MSKINSIKENLSHEYLTSMLDYDPETGVFTWKVNKSYKINPGDKAGSVTNQDYIAIGIDGFIFHAHRLAWFYVHKEWPEEIIHVNYNNVDNRISNLQNVSHAEYMKHKKLRSSKSGHLGVHFHKSSGKYQAKIETIREISWGGLVTQHKKIKNLGFFDTIEEAIQARKDAERKHLSTHVG